MVRLHFKQYIDWLIELILSFKNFENLSSIPAHSFCFSIFLFLFCDPRAFFSASLYLGSSHQIRFKWKHSRGAVWEEEEEEEEGGGRSGGGERLISDMPPLLIISFTQTLLNTDSKWCDLYHFGSSSMAVPLCAAAYFYAIGSASIRNKYHETHNYLRCLVTVCNSRAWSQITGLQTLTCV